MENEEKKEANTIVTSVSVSKRMKEYLDEYGFSPTEVFRRGMAVFLCDVGVETYATQKNRSRIQLIQGFLSTLEELEQLEDSLYKLRSKIYLFIKDYEEFKK